MKILDKEFNVEGRLIRIGRLKAEQFESFPDPAAAIDAIRQSGTPIDLFTFVEKLPNILPRFRYLSEWDNLAALPVTTFDDWWKKQIDGKTRNMVRRAEKGGVAIREVLFDDALVQGISGIYNESRIRQGKPFSHYQKSLEAVRGENGTFLDRSVFIGAFLGETLIGFAKVVSDEDRQQAGLMQIVSMIGHRDKAPTNALIAQAVRSCAERRIPYLFYSHFSYGRKHRDSLSDFKQHNGFQRIDLPRYYVPLTLVGRAALRLGLHRGRLIDLIPESMQARLRSIRHLRSFRSLETTPRIS
jgi:hypothetical protein